MHRHVLIVDDDEDARCSIGVLLELHGYTVDLAENGQAALDRLRTQPPPCLVVLDLMMPGMNGWELRAQMLQDPGLSRVPVLVMSGAADLDEETGRLDAVDCMAKPIDVDRLIRTVRANC
jgi:CheY-like chemotaxis protein